MSDHMYHSTYGSYVSYVSYVMYPSCVSCVVCTAQFMLVMYQLMYSPKKDEFRLSEENVSVLKQCSLCVNMCPLLLKIKTYFTTRSPSTFASLAMVRSLRPV